MGKYVKYTPPANPTAKELAEAVMTAWSRAVSEHGTEMSDNYLKGMQEANIDLGIERLATWYKLFFARNVGAKYREDIKDVITEYRRSRPRGYGGGK